MASDMGKRQSKENLRSQEIITLDSIEHSDFSVMIEAPNGSPQPMSTFYIERYFQRVLTHPIPSSNEGDMSITSSIKKQRLFNPLNPIFLLPTLYSILPYSFPPTLATYNHFQIHFPSTQILNHVHPQSISIIFKLQNPSQNPQPYLC